MGTLKGYDQLMNLVLDEVKEVLRGRHGSESLLAFCCGGFAGWSD